MPHRQDDTRRSQMRSIATIAAVLAALAVLALLFAVVSAPLW